MGKFKKFHHILKTTLGHYWDAAGDRGIGRKSVVPVSLHFIPSSISMFTLFILALVNMIILIKHRETIKHM